MVEKRCCRSKPWGILSVSLILVMAWISATALAAPLPGGTLNPLTIPKYVQPLVIPPEMPSATVQPAVPGVDPNNIPAAKYNIAVRQFQQQILPGGVWNTVNGRSDAFPPTPIWSYGPEQDLPPPGYVAPAALGSPGANYNYPAFNDRTLDQ